MKKFFTHFSYFLQKHISPQTLVYIILWTIIFAMPLTRNMVLNDYEVDNSIWQYAATIWLFIMPYFIFFIINAIILIPHLFMKQKIGFYIVSISLLLIVTLYTSDIIGICHRQSTLPAEEEMFDPINNTPRDIIYPPFRKHNDSFFFDKPDDMPNGPHPWMHILHGPFFGKLFIALLLISFNLSVELFFKSQRDKKKITQLKYNEMQTKLDYLKYQINPHFFMNTLNNIHALVDIDTEKAKQTVVELSKLMRYVLYEADKKMILLQKEIQFLNHYAELMRIRYPSDSVKIELDLQKDTGNVVIPPLLFISFVENAFKHGVSFRTESYVKISMRTDNQNIIFTCCNSNAKHNQDQHHGIGLDNIRNRLELLYPNKYVLSITEQDNEFGVLMVIPAQTENNDEK